MRVKKLTVVISCVLLLGSGAGMAAPTPEQLDHLLAPIALYPDQLLAQMLLCATDPSGVAALNQFLKSHPTLKGTELQDAALKDNFDASFVALAPFGQIVDMMAADLDWTTQLGEAFTTDKAAVFASIQRLRKQAHDAGNLKTTPQQEVESRTTSSGEQVIVIEPSNPQVVYVPQYNSTTVYTTPGTSTTTVVTPATSTTTVVVEKDSSADAAVAGMIGFTAGIAIGAAVSTPYYYGPYGWHGGAYMYNDAWDDYYDAREDAREDWMDHREDIVEERGERAQNAQEQRSERTENRQENRPESQAQREQRRSDAQTAASERKASGSSYESRGYSESGQRAGTGERAATQDRSGTRSNAFSDYSSGKSTRAASSRGQSSRSSSSRSRGGGRRR
jgi:hypothetical protein